MAGLNNLKCYSVEEKIKLLIRLYYFRIEKNYTVNELVTMLRTKHTTYYHWMRLMALPSVEKCYKIDMITKGWTSAMIKEEDMYTDMDTKIAEYKAYNAKQIKRYKDWADLNKLNKQNKSVSVDTTTI